MTKPIDHILVPTDFSEHAEHALLYAASLGERFGATIHLAHVVTLGDVDKDEEQTEFPDIDAHLERADLAAREKRDAGVDHGGMASAQVERVVLRSVNPHEGIIKYAEEKAIDLIVIALRGRSPMSAMVMGSVTERVIRYAPCPVLVVEQGDRDFVDPETAAVRIEKVAVAHDLSENADRALAFAVHQLRPYRPEIHLLHVVEMKLPQPYLDVGVSYSFDVNDRAAERIVEELRERADAVVPEDWTVVCHLDQGKPHKEVIEMAGQAKADLLVVGSESNRTLAERIAGGTSERMVRHAPCPTLIA